MSIADLMTQEKRAGVSDPDSSAASWHARLQDPTPKKRIRPPMPEGFELPKFRGSAPKDLRAYFDDVLSVMRMLAMRNVKVLRNVRVPITWKSPVDHVERVFYRTTVEIEYDAIQRTPYKRRRWQTAAQAYRVQKRINKRDPVERVYATLRLTQKQALLLAHAMKERK